MRSAASALRFFTPAAVARRSSIPYFWPVRSSISYNYCAEFKIDAIFVFTPLNFIRSLIVFVVVCAASPYKIRGVVYRASVLDVEARESHEVNRFNAVLDSRQTPELL